jgi:hypothetical protein
MDAAFGLDQRIAVLLSQGSKQRRRKYGSQAYFFDMFRTHQYEPTRIFRNIAALGLLHHADCLVSGGGKSLHDNDQNLQGTAAIGSSLASWRTLAL